MVGVCRRGGRRSQSIAAKASRLPPACVLPADFQQAGWGATGDEPAVRRI